MMLKVTLQNIKKTGLTRLKSKVGSPKNSRLLFCKSLGELSYKTLTFLLFTIITCNVSFGQSIHDIKKETSIDTLSIWVKYPTNFDNSRIKVFDGLLDQTINKGNTKFSFFTKADKTSSAHSLLITMNTISYVTRKDNLMPTVGNLLVIGGHVAMVASFGWTLPILLYFSPDTSSDITIEFTDHIANYELLIDSQITSAGYFSSIRRQDNRFEKSFQKSTYQLLKQINRRNRKNNKKQK